MEPRRTMDAGTPLSIVITYGTFDLLHIGHLRLLKKARSMGDYLIVAVSTDEFNKAKGKKSSQPYHLRKQVIEHLPFVDEVIAECSWEQKSEDVVKYRVTTLVMGDDWEGEFDDLPCEVTYLPRTEGISSTELREWLN